MPAADAHPHRSRHPFRRRRHAAVAAVARDRAEAVDAAAGRRDAARARPRPARSAVAGVADLVTVTNREYYFHTKDAYAGLRGRLAAAHVVPARAFRPQHRARRRARRRCGRSAATATMSCCWCLPADHLIRDHAAFAAAVARPRRLAQGGSLVTFGIAPAHPETGFGYIECGAPIAGDGPLRSAASASSRSRRSTRRASTSPPATICGTRGCSASRRARSSPRSSAMRRQSLDAVRAVVAAA